MCGKTYSHINYQQTNLRYQKFGKGPKIILAFHGYGQNCDVFKEIALTRSNQYTTYSFDLFFHGKSYWSFGHKPLENAYWGSLMQQFLNKVPVDKFTLLGYSMGGKFVLATLKIYPELVEELILVAPDGIKTNGWYSLATYPLFLRHLFKWTINHPSPLFHVMNIMRSLKIIDKGIIKFAKLQMNSPMKRYRVYSSWVVFRHLIFDMDEIATLINKKNITTTMFLGAYDKIMTRNNMDNLLLKLKLYDLKELKCGHNQLLQNVAIYFEQNHQ